MMQHQTVEYIRHCALVTDFKSMLKYSDWSNYTFVATELNNLCTKGRNAISPSYDVSWSLDGDRMRVNIAGTRLALEKRLNRNGIAVWRLV